MNQLTILGGGPAGLGAAFYANRANLPFVLFERSGALGGMCRTFRHGEHFYNFDGLRRYKTKFDPTWVPKYLVAPGGIALPRILVDVSMLISGGMKELFAR